MDKILSENLFLLEFLVDKVNLIPGAVPREISDVTGETCVSFKFLDNDPMDICEADFAPRRDYSNDSGNMKNGKSCLFAITPSQANEALQKFDVEVAIFKKLTNGVLPDKLQIGYSVVPVACIFNEILQLLQTKAESGTVSRTLKESFPISNPCGENIGEVAVFVRMSCFGKLIVTQFQMNLEEKSVFFKDKEGKSLYKYRKASKSEAAASRGSSQWSSRQEKESGRQPVCEKWNDAIGSKSYQQTDYSSNGDGYCKECNEPPIAETECCFTPQPPCMVQPPCMIPQLPPCMMPAPCMILQPQPPPKGCYQEIGAEMNGNALTIRVHKNKGLTVRKVEEDGTESQIPSEACHCGSPPKASNKSNCGCGSNGGNQASDPCRCVMSNLPCNVPAPCAEKQILSMKPADDPNNPFTFKMSGCGNTARENITVVPPCSTRPDGMQVTEISDPSKDVFILRIGKKSEGTDKKANLELELVTPKAPDKKPIPKKETRDTQYLDSDVPGSGGKKKKKPKKGKKGKKK